MINSSKRKIWIISELFPPEETSTGYILGEIANALTYKYTVGVICGPSIYDSKKKQDVNSLIKVNESIEVFRVIGVSENKNSKLSRIKKFLLISWRLYSVAKKHIKEGDHVLMVTNPFPLIVLMSYLRKCRDFHLSMLVHDIAPEGLFTDIHIPKIFYKLVKRIFDKAYSSTDQLISIGRDMKDVLEKKCSYSIKPKICIIENWADIENIIPCPFNTSCKIRIQYAGNIGNAQGIEEFIDVLYESDCENVEFSIWGTGGAENNIKKKVENLDLKDIVKFNGPYFRSQQQYVLNDCDIALVRLVEGMYGLGVPSKFYNILAAGKPVLYIGERNTEIWRVLEENQNGFYFSPSDRDGLKKFLNSLNLSMRSKFIEMGEISRNLAENKYSKKIILNKYVQVI